MLRAVAHGPPMFYLPVVFRSCGRVCEVVVVGARGLGVPPEVVGMLVVHSLLPAPGGMGNIVIVWAPADSPAAFEPTADQQPAPCVQRRDSPTRSWAERTSRKRDANASDEPVCLWQCASSLMHHPSILGDAHAFALRHLINCLYSDLLL